MTFANPAKGRSIEVGVIVAATAGSGDLERFADRLTRECKDQLESATARSWTFARGEVVKLDGDDNRTGADFVGSASLRLAEGSYDLMIVVTDAPLLSSRDRIVSGLASPLTRTCILSTRNLRKPKRGEPLPLDSPTVHWNAATLLLNLIGRVMGARTDAPSGAMARFHPDFARTRVEAYDPPDEIRERSSRFAEEEYRISGPLSSLWAHFRSLLHDPGMLFRALVRNRAPFLPLRLPGLATAALAPVFLLVFTAEMWDAGLGMSNLTATFYALISIAAATLYLTFAQNLFLPRKDSPVLPRHLALANVVIFVTILLGIVGLFVMLTFISLALEIWVFPQGLIATWPTLEAPEVSFIDKLRLAVFISTVGVSTGALAGGLQRRNVLRQLALFETVA